MNSLSMLKVICNISIFSFLSVSVFASNFYVSPNGNDSNTGTKENPFASLERAKIAIQNSIQKNNDEEYFVFMADGFYEIEKPVVFDSKYFSTGKRIKVKALENERPVISGGIRLQAWKKDEAGFWHAELPNKGNGNWNPRELFIDGKRGIRARFPNEEYLRVKKVGKDRRTNFFFEKGEFPIPENANGVELILLHDWSISRIAVKNINPQKSKLTAIDSIGAKSPVFFNLDNWEKNPRYFLENAIEFLDADYEWFIDSKKQKVYLKLPENENPNSVQVVVPFANGIVQISGTENKPIKNIHFEGITFRHCNWEIPEDGYCGVQACYFDARPEIGWKEVPAAIKVEWAENCTFEKCSFENLGISGLWFSTGCKSCSVTNSGFFDISANGIMIGEGRDRYIDGEVWWKAAPEQVAFNNSVENCKIENCGTQFFGAIGIWCGFTAKTKIRNNEIFNLPYSGISIGWEWSPAETPCRDNLIDGNHIHHIMQKLSDGGGIYMLGLQPGSKIRNNHIHDVELNAGRAESNGMFLDEGITDVVVQNNLIYNIAKSPIRFHKATTNLVRNNYLFCSGENPPIRYNSTKENDIKKVGNKVIIEGDINYSQELKKVIAIWGK
jgi:hypothetical protein